MFLVKRAGSLCCRELEVRQEESSIRAWSFPFLRICDTYIIYHIEKNQVMSESKTCTYASMMSREKGRRGGKTKQHLCTIFVDRVRHMREEERKREVTHTHTHALVFIRCSETRKFQRSACRLLFQDVFHMHIQIDHPRRRDYLRLCGLGGNRTYQ